MITQILVILVLIQIGCMPFRAESKLSIDVTKSGSYQISVNDQLFFSNGSTSFYSKSWFSTKTGTLQLKSYKDISGTDELGKYTGGTFEYFSTSQIEMEATYKTYSSHPDVLVFEQYFPNGLMNSSTGNDEQAITVFPSLTSTSTELNYYTWYGTFNYPKIGKFSNLKEMEKVTGIQGGAVTFFDKDLNTVVVSSLKNYMVGIGSVATDDGQFSLGIEGMVESLPKGFTHQVVMVSGNGVQDGIMKWGEVLLKKGGKSRTPVDADVGSAKLSYWTDNGAYYYYHTEEGKNYAETMIDVAKNTTDIPFKSYQFDSWWYPKSSDGDGVTEWVPTKEVFPDGMDSVDKGIGNLPLTLHNRYFAPKNSYQDKFPFIVENGSKCSLPTNEALYTYIMQTAKAWGLSTYEQDWLVTTYMDMKATRNNVDNARNWIENMGNAAKKLDLTIQLCMPLPVHVLQSTTLQSITNSRASTDYHPNNDDWKIAHTSLLLNAVGLLPFKDNMWSTATQDGCPYKNDCTEQNTVLITTASALSTGPVAYSDAIGHFNTKLIKSTCRSDGVLLKADQPAMPLDLTFSSQFSSPKIVELWETHSTHSSNVAVSYLLAADLPDSFKVLPTDIGRDSASKALVVDFYNQGTHAIFSSSSPIVFNKASVPAFVSTPEKEAKKIELIRDWRNKYEGERSSYAVEFKYYVVTSNFGDVPSGGHVWSLFGETDKVVTASKQRFSNLVSGSSNLAGDLTGEANEKLSLLVYKVGENDSVTPVTFSCTLDGSGKGKFSCTDSCSC